MEGNESENVNSSATNDNGEDLLNVSFTPKRNFVCIAYPGIVENDEKAMATLGGIESIKQTVQNPAKRLEMRLRPDDVYCKPALGTSTESTSLLLRVKRRRKKGPATGSQESTGKGDNQEEWKTDILGTVKSTVRFQGMFDFQYLPMARQEDGTYRDILKDLTFSKFVSLREWLKRDDIPLFLPPLMFSRTDVPNMYLYRPSAVSQESTTSTEPQSTNLIRTSRKKRTVFTQFRKFDDKSIPTAPIEGAAEALKTIIRDMDKLEEVKKMFEDRPIWSKNALMHRTGLDKNVLKVILPLVAYYCVTGPWRSLWVRLGFDPRTDPAAKPYQVLDCRIRQRGAVDKLWVKGKRSVFTYTAPNTIRKTARHTSKIKVSSLEPPTEETVKTDEKDDSTFVYRPGVQPPYRCMFYQYCDVVEENCQKLLHQNDGQETECTEKDGWCVKDIGTQCRAIIYKHLKKLQLRDEFPKTHKASTDIYMTESDEDSLDDNEPMDEDFASDEEMNDMETEMLDAV